MESMQGGSLSESDGGEFTLNTPSFSPPCSQPPSKGVVVPDTPEHVWTTPQRELIKKREVMMNLSDRLKGNMKWLSPQKVERPCEIPSPPSSYEIPSPKSNEIPGHEMLRLLVPTYFYGKSVK